MPHPDVKPSYKRPVIGPKSCPVMERTGDGRSAGRCWFFMNNIDVCPRHGKIAFEKETCKPDSL